MEASILFVNYLLRGFGFQKLYGETPEQVASEFSAGFGERVEVEGRLRNHEYLDGTWHDVLVVALYRDPWLELAEKWIARLNADMAGEVTQRIDRARTAYRSLALACVNLGRRDAAHARGRIRRSPNPAAL